MLLAKGGRDAANRARQLAGQALERGEELGFTRVAKQARVLL